MPIVCFRATATLTLLCALSLSWARADEPCRAVDISFRPAPRLQLAVWVEDTRDRYVDTIYVSRVTGTLGLGNRPGNARFKSAYRWPYGRREMVLPVWAHRRNHLYGYVVMGGADGLDPNDNTVGYHERFSSTEPFYCTPGNQPVDATSCASVFSSSKGVYAQGRTSLYPPRADLATFGIADSTAARGFAGSNDLAAISGATPSGGVVIAPPLRWHVPANVASGDYVLWVEASLEADFNASHHHPSYLDDNDGLRVYGHDILGQPSVVYRLPIHVDGSNEVFITNSWQGYGSWDGSSGTVSPPDSTISDAPGTGAGRLDHVTDDAGTWRVKAVSGGCQDCAAPPAVGALTAVASDNTATLKFMAPAGGAGMRYEIRYRTGMPLDDSSFSEGVPSEISAPPSAPGSMQTVVLSGLKADTSYSVGLRVLSPCGAPSPGSYASFVTERQRFVVLHGCFVATAAYGSPLAADLEALRQVRDRLLLVSPLGQLAVAVYYSLSPPLAGAISADERLRAAARSALHPVVVLAKGWLAHHR